MSPLNEIETYAYFRTTGTLNGSISLCNGDLVRFERNNWLLGENIDAFCVSIIPTLGNERCKHQLVPSSYISMIVQEYQSDSQRHWDQRTTSQWVFQLNRPNMLFWKAITTALTRYSVARGNRAVT